ncbi:MAG: ammonium transporter, partial [Sporolactobacillus laevolacticus]|nr:ammonium transporter [Sporolactobacillus laevolacticus]
MKTTDAITLSLDSLWVLVAAILVILMQAGFAFLEAGSLQSK